LGRFINLLKAGQNVGPQYGDQPRYRGLRITKPTPTPNELPVNKLRKSGQQWKLYTVIGTIVAKCLRPGGRSASRLFKGTIKFAKRLQAHIVLLCHNVWFRDKTIVDGQSTTIKRCSTSASGRRRHWHNPASGASWVTRPATNFKLFTAGYPLRHGQCPGQRTGRLANRIF